MTTEQVINLAKEKLGRDLTAQEAQDYLSGKTAIPDEALAIVSGGGNCFRIACTNCGSTDYTPNAQLQDWYSCNNCGKQWFQYLNPVGYM